MLKSTDSWFVLLKWIARLIYPLHNLITFSKFILHALWTILWQLKMSWKITIFWYVSKKMLTSSNFHQQLACKKYVIEFEIVKLYAYHVSWPWLKQINFWVGGDDLSPPPPACGWPKKSRLDRVNLGIYIFHFYSSWYTICKQQNYIFFIGHNCIRIWIYNISYWCLVYTWSS